MAVGNAPFSPKCLTGLMLAPAPRAGRICGCAPGQARNHFHDTSAPTRGDDRGRGATRRVATADSLNPERKE